MQPKFSIIVPVFNVEDYLRQCLDSILRQSYDDYECILVDDGSTDGSGAICDEYAQNDPSHYRVVHQINGGASSARNFGIVHAAGEYLLFIDSDDFWYDHTFLLNLSECINSSRVDIVQYGVRKYSTTTSQFTSGGNRDVRGLNSVASQDILAELVTSGNLQITAYSMALSRDFVISNNLLFKEGIKSEDIEWAIRVFSKSPSWQFMNNEVYAYRQNREGSVTASIDYAHLMDYVGIIHSSMEVSEGCDAETRSALISYLMYHVLIVAGLAQRTGLPKHQRDDILSDMEDVFKRNVLGHTLNKKVKLASQLSSLIGYGPTLRLVGFYLKNRGR